MKNKYESEQLIVCHESAQALYRIGAIDSDKMREFDEMCIVPEVAPSQRMVKDLAKREREPALAAQAVRAFRRRVKR
jgi:putative transcriptional regulator